MIDLPRIILASASPRRAEILRTVRWQFEALPVDIDESRRPQETATEYVERLAREKAEKAASVISGDAAVKERLRSTSMIVAADTTVTIDGHILEKPLDAADATRMLRLLNNRWHKVITGVALMDRAKSAVLVARQETEVKFAPISDEEIDWYVETGEPMDKAGAYAIQGVGARLIEAISGDYFNVVGLPLRLLYELVVQER